MDKCLDLEDTDTDEETCSGRFHSPLYHCLSLDSSVYTLCRPPLKKKFFLSFSVTRKFHKLPKFPKLKYSFPHAKR